MKKIGLSLLLALAFLSVKAQEKSLNTDGCATVTSPQEMQELYDFVHSQLPQLKTTAGVDTIPLTIHRVGDNNGDGLYKYETLFKMICNLNIKYAPVGFFFYIKFPLRQINNSNYFVHNYQSGAQMMYANNVANTINMYFVSDPSGACGYYTYGPDAIAISNACAGINSTTVTHEIGHYMGLPHTFSGWENGATPSNPEKVTRGAGANCSVAGDLFCDTDADYLGARWNCPYTGFKLDTDNVPYHPDSSLYMSYSTDACMSRFSNQQIARMENRLLSRSNLLLNTPSFSAISDTAKIVYPVDTMYANFQQVKWNKVPGATNYYVKVTLANIPSFIKYETVTADTFTTVGNLNTDNYIFRVHVVPMHGADVCMNTTSSIPFVFSSKNNPFSIANAAANKSNLLSVINPVQNKQVQFQLSVPAGEEFMAQVFNLNGALIATKKLKQLSAVQSYSMTLPEVSAGIYVLKLQGATMLQTQKIVVE